MPAIETKALTKCFDDVTAVDRLTIAVDKGEIFGLVGPDGAGKTTTMRLLTGIMTPTAGEAWVAGYQVGHEDERIKEHIAYMSQRFGLYPDLTVMENIEFYADIYNQPRQGRSAIIDRLLDFSGLKPFKKRLAGNLSGGMKQKLGLACALVHTPEVLFLDEPTNGVDPVSRRDFWRILNNLQREKVTIFLSTAYLDEAERCHRVGLIHRGQLLAVGTPAELKKMMRGAIFELRTANPRRTTEIIRHKIPDLSAGLFGDSVHVVCRDPSFSISQVETILAHAGIRKLEIQPIAPSLEDVFVSVLTDSEEPQMTETASKEPKP